MLFISATIIIAYMLNDTLGMILMAGYSFWKMMLSKKNSLLYRLMELMITALPMAYIGIAGVSMHQILSWYNVFLTMFIISVCSRLKCSIKVPAIALLSTYIILVCLLLNTYWNENVSDTLIEVAQIMIMMLPIIIVHSSRYVLPFSLDQIYKLIEKYADICVATSVGMLVQYIFYRFLNKSIGIIMLSGGGRASMFCLFRGASILPIFMGLGIVFLLIECLAKKVTVQSAVKILIIFLAVLFNNSRTALFILMVICAIICLKYFIHRFYLGTLLAIIVGLIGSYVAINYTLTSRQHLQGFLDDNHRFLTFQNGMNIWLANEKNFILGEGFTGGRWEGITKPHNFVIQTLAQCGIIVFIIVACLLCKYFLDNSHNPYLFMPLFIIGSSMLVTDFYANAFTTVIFMIIDLYSGKMDFYLQRNIIEERKRGLEDSDKSITLCSGI